MSPVKVLPDGVRQEKFLADNAYAHNRNGLCIFRSTLDRSCRIHAHKPFGCTLLICGKMTRAKPLMLNKTYYYHQWHDSQEIVFSIFPGLASLHRKLVETISPLPMPGRRRTAALTAANAIIHDEMYGMMNGCHSRDNSFYRNRNLV